MAINFPTAPSTGQEYTYLGKTWEYNGTGWVPVPGSIVTIPAGRELLIAARTYYVATTGSDSNNGLAIGTPFLTIQKAVDVICNTLDLQSYAITIQVADGTYTGATTFGSYVGSSTTSGITIQGNISTPANVIISTPSANCFSALSGVSSGLWIVKDMKLQTTTSGWCIRGGAGAEVRFGNINFGAAGSGHIYNPNGLLLSISNYAISGSAPYHINTEGNGITFSYYKTITITGTPAFSTSFAIANYRGSIILEGNTYSGSATGKYYAANSGGWIHSSTQLPGNAVGTISNGGAYY